MKYITLIMFSLFAYGCAPVNKIDVSKPFSFTLIDTVAGVSKNDLYIRANEWIAKQFNSANDVIQMHDKEAGKIIGKATFSIPGRDGLGVIVGEDYIHFTISIDVKDSRYRCVLSDFYHTAGNYSSSMGGHVYNHDFGSLDQGAIPMQQHKWEEIKSMSRKKAENTLASLKKSMTQNTSDF